MLNARTIHDRRSFKMEIKMTRQQIINTAPIEWEIRRQENKVCPVCCKYKSLFEKFKRVYCSDKCAREYQSKWITWNGLRNKILERDRHKCNHCGFKGSLEVDHIKAIVNGGDMWDEDNVQALCKKCHNKKTKLDLKKRTKGNNILQLNKRPLTW